MSFQKYFRNLREEKGKTQKQFAKELCVSLATIKKIENGYINMPSPRLLLALSGYLQIDCRHIVRDILFYDESKYDINVSIFLQLFLSHLYLDGWNFSIGPMYEHRLVGLRVYPAFVYKGNGMRTQDRMLIDLISHHEEYKTMEYDKESVEQFMTNWLLEIIQLSGLPSVCRVILLFDSKKERDVKLFELVNYLPTKYLKLKICILLYDAEKNVIEEYRLIDDTGSFYTKFSEQL